MKTFLLWALAGVAIGFFARNWLTSNVAALNAAANLLVPSTAQTSS